MDSSEAIYEGLKNAGINFIVSVPCVNLLKLLKLVEKDSAIKNVPVTREEEGFGLCVGAYMGGLKPAILMQNSGLGNSVNVLASLVNLYQIPILIIISQRGTFGEGICGQIPMGKATIKVLDSLNIMYYIPHTKEEAKELVKKSWDLAKMSEQPYVLLFEIRFWKL